MGPLWGIAVVGMTAVLLIVAVLRLSVSRAKLSGEGSGTLIAIGIVIGLAVAGIGLLAGWTS